MMDLPRWMDRFEPVARTSWWLHEAESLWLVDEGAVDVFATGISNDLPVGTRRPLFRVPAGSSMMPLERSVMEDGQALIAVPLPQTRIRAIPLAELQQHAAHDGDRDFVSSLVTSWVDVITRGTPRPPDDRRVLRPVEPLAMQPGETFCAVDRLSWVKVSGGTVAFMGEADLPITPDMPPLPFPSDAWGRAISPVCIRSVDEHGLTASGEFWHGARTYQMLAIRCAVRAIEQRSRKEGERLQVRAEQTAKVMDEALSRLASVVDGAPYIPPELSTDPLLAACQLVGRQIGVAFRAAPRRTQPATGMDRLQEIADASNVRTRSVALKDEWWRHDNGPLLAFTAEARQPCALIPFKDRCYDLHNTATGSVVRVTAEVAQTITPFATQFYRPFPAQAIKLVDILRFALQGRSRDIASMVVLGVLGGLVGMAIPVAAGRMVDTVIPSARQNDAIALMLALLAAILSTLVFEIVRSIAVLRVEGKMDGAVQSAVWDRVLALPVPFFRSYTAGDLADRINGLNVIRHALSGTTVTTLLSSFFSLLSLFLLFYYSVTLAVVATLLTLLAVAVVLTTGFIKLRYERQLAELAGHLSGTVLQYLIGIVKLRVAAADRSAFANWAREFTRLRIVAFKAKRIAIVDHVFFAGYSILINAVVFAVVGIFMVAQSGTRLSIGDFVAFNAAFAAFFVALVTLCETTLGLLNLSPVYGRAKPILEGVVEVDAARKHPGELRGSIEVVNLGFSYTKEQEVLKDASFSVPAGGFIALVGPSGSGKSTLLRLLLGFEKPSRGSIFYDHQDLADLDVRGVRRQLGVVLQGGQLMTGDILSNIIGSSQLTVDDAWEAARMVGLEEDINEMPMGMHTLISEASSTFSGGQRQRILIARAIIHRPRILLFDEATSALDNRTQAIVSRSLEQLKATRIVIAHRLSTVIHADSIIVLQNGRVVQTGNYKELIAQEGPFADLARRQIA